MSSIVVPPGTVNIAANAYLNNTTATSATIPTSVVTIGTSAFQGCSNLALVTFTPTSSLTTIGASVFYNCFSLNNFTIPTTVTSIGTEAFGFCSSLTSINIPSGVTTLGFGVFEVCTNLVSVTIPNTMTTIGADVFLQCNNLTTVTFTPTSSLTSIGARVFYKCYKLTSISIPSSVTSIGISTFSYSGLTSITLPSSITIIPVNCFAFCATLASISLPNTTTSISDAAFANCVALTSITIPAAVTTLGQGAFYGCSIITSVVIPSGVTTLQQYLFSQCTSLTSITIPNTVTTIGDYAFENCTSLKNISLPSGLTSVGANSFLTSGVVNVNYCGSMNLTSYFPVGTYITCPGADYYLVPSSAKMHICTTGKANIGSNSTSIVSGALSSYAMNVNGQINANGIYSSSNAIYNNAYSSGNVIQIVADVSANRPTTNYPGYIRYCTDAGLDTLEFYSVTQNTYLPLWSPPKITSITPLTIANQTYTITGLNFATNCSVYFIGSDLLTTFRSLNVSSNNSTTITALAPAGLYSSSGLALSPWSVRVINNASGLFNTLYNAIFSSINWVSPSPGSNLGPFYTSYYYNTTTSIATQFVATASGANSFTYSFDPTVNSSLISQYNLSITTVANVGYLTTGTNGSTPIPNGSTSTNVSFTVGIVVANFGVTLTTQTFTVRIQPAWIPALTISPAVTPTTYTAAGTGYQYRVYSFKPSTTTSNTQYTITISGAVDPSFSAVDVLLVGGGGGGGGGYQSGGGAGGAVISTTALLGYCGGPSYGGAGTPVNPTGLGPYTINNGTNLSLNTNPYYAVVGGGGLGAYYNYNSPYSTAPTNGGNSAFYYQTTSGNPLFMALGGGAGGFEENITSNPPTNSVFGNGLPGGNGGGGSHFGPQNPSPPSFSAIPGASAVATNGGANNTITINGTLYQGSSIPGGGVFGYVGGSGISTNYPYINSLGCFGGGGGGGAGGGVYSSSNVANNINAYVDGVSNTSQVAGKGGNGILNTIDNTTTYYGPGGSGAMRGNNGTAVNVGGLGQTGTGGSGYEFPTTSTPGTAYFGPNQNGASGQGGGGGGGGTSTGGEDNTYSGMTAGQGGTGCVILRYRFG